MKIKQEFKNNFSAGKISKRLYGRTDSNAYENGVKEMENCIPLIQGSVLNKKISLSQAAEIESFQWNTVDFIANTLKNSLYNDGKDYFYIIGQEKFSHNVYTYVLRNDEGALTLLYTGVTFLAEYLTFLSGQAGTSLYFNKKPRTANIGNTKLTFDTIIIGNIEDEYFDDPDYKFTSNILITPDVPTGFSVTGVEVTNGATVDSFSYASDTITIDFTPDSPNIINVNKNIEVVNDWNSSYTVIESYPYSEIIDTKLYRGELELSDFVIYLTPEEAYSDSSEDISIDDKENGYVITSTKVLDLLGEILFYKNTIQYYKIKLFYFGVLSYNSFSPIFKIFYEFDKPTTEITSNLIIGKMSELVSGEFEVESFYAPSEVIDYPPIYPVPYLSAKLLADYGYTGNLYTYWKYDPTTSYIQFYFKSTDSPTGTDITIGGLYPAAAISEMAEMSILGGICRYRNDPSNPYDWIIKTEPSVNTYNYTTSTTDTRAIDKESVYFYDIMDVDTASVITTYQNRLILGNFSHGSSYMAMSIFGNPKDFSTTNYSTSGFSGQISDDETLAITGFRGYRTVLIYTNKGIYTTPFYSTGISPSTLSFYRLTSIVPLYDISPEFIDDTFIFVNYDRNKIYNIKVAEDNDVYVISDLTEAIPGEIDGIVNVSRVKILNEDAYSYLLISSLNQNGIMLFNSARNTLGWVETNIENKLFDKTLHGFDDDFLVEGQTGIIHKVGSEFSQDMTIELLKPSFTVLDRITQYKNVIIKILGEGSISINNSEEKSFPDPEYPDDSIIRFDYVDTINGEFTIKINSDKEAILLAIYREVS